MKPGAVTRRLVLTSGLAGLALRRRPARAAPAMASPVLRWNAETVAAIRATATDPFLASRALALASIAVFDTLRAIDRGPAFLVQADVPAELRSAALEPAAVEPARLKPVGLRSMGLRSELGSGGLTSASLESGELRSAGLESGGPRSVALRPARLGQAGLWPAGLELRRMEPADLEPAGLRSAALEPAGLNPAGLRPAALGPARLGPADRVKHAAIAGAAHQVLVALFPARRTAADHALAAALADATPDHAAAVAFGRAVADSVLLRRDDDGWRNQGSVPPPTAPGMWRPTEPSRLPALHPEWKNVTPFSLTTPSQFRPPPPPPLDSAAFREARDKVALLGARDSLYRTPDQTLAARFWNDPAGSDTPPGHWNVIAAHLIAAAGLPLHAQAEVLAQLNVALADAGVAVADAKYTYLLWRPITAIRAGDAQTRPVQDWLPLIDTPNHPSYISGHSTFSGAAQAVLSARLGSAAFTTSNVSLPGVTRRFTDVRHAAEEAAASRLWGGIHYEFENVLGLATGCAVGAWTVAAFTALDGDPEPVVVLDGATGGYAFASRQPVTSLTLALGDAVPVPVAVDARGYFAVPPLPRDQAPGLEMVLRATSSTGQVRTMTVDVATR